MSFSRFILQISNAMAKTKKFICRGHLTRDHKFVLGCFEDAFFNFFLAQSDKVFRVRNGDSLPEF